MNDKEPRIGFGAGLARSVLGLLCAVAALAGADRARAEEGGSYVVTPPRLSFTEDPVSFWRPGAEEWSGARVNTALAAGDRLYAGAGGRFELEMGGASFLRASGGTEVGLDSLEPDYLQFRVTAGRVALDVRHLRAGRTLELATPHGAITVEDPGFYDVVVADDTTGFTVRRGGRGLLGTSAATAVAVYSNQRAILAGEPDSGDSVVRSVEPASDLDDWESWNYGRTDGLLESESRRYVAPEVAGAAELDRHGSWQTVRTYGRVWVPAGVAPSWAPYSTGRWMWDPYYGWTWVDDAPWGWAPYHYGRWVYVDDYWAWAPGPIVVRPVYSPALVAFFDVGRVRVGVAGPSVAWVALGWGEPVVPWWGPPGFMGVPCWNGWGGPWYVNHAVVHHHHEVHPEKIRYEHAGRHHAVMRADAERFRHGDHGPPGRLPAEDREHMRNVAGRPDVRPSSASLSSGRVRAERPPHAVSGRTVFATRRPQDAGRRLSESGLTPPPAEGPAEVKLVQPPPRRPGHNAFDPHRRVSGRRPGARDTVPSGPRPTDAQREILRSMSPRSGPAPRQRPAAGRPPARPVEEPAADGPREGDAEVGAPVRPGGGDPGEVRRGHFGAGPRDSIPAGEEAPELHTEPSGGAPGLSDRSSQRPRHDSGSRGPDAFRPRSSTGPDRYRAAPPAPAAPSSGDPRPDAPARRREGFAPRPDAGAGSTRVAPPQGGGGHQPARPPDSGRRPDGGGGARESFGAGGRGGHARPEPPRQAPGSVAPSQPQMPQRPPPGAMPPQGRGAGPASRPGGFSRPPVDR